MRRCNPGLEGSALQASHRKLEAVSDFETRLLHARLIELGVTYHWLITGLSQSRQMTFDNCAACVAHQTDKTRSI